MKTFKYIAITLGILLMSGINHSASASNSIAKSLGISDGLLFGMMIAFILLLLAIIKALSGSIDSISKSPRFKKDYKEPAAKALLALVTFGSSIGLNAQATIETPRVPDFFMSNMVFWVLLSLIIFLSVVIWILFRSLNTLIQLERGESFEIAAEEKTEDLFETLKLTDRVPIEEEDEILMDHEYDGIRELDNNLPPWWKYMFYATILFAFIYLIRFHITGGGMLSHEEYAMQMEEAVAAKAELMAEAGESINEDNVVYLVDAPSIEKGAAIYKGNCATCHGQLGEGGAGPNLTDEYWLHGGNINSIFGTIKNGVPAKGMIAWESQFSPSQMQQVASFVMSLKGSNPPNGKSPQGEIYVEEIITEATDSTAADTIEVVVEID